MKHTKSININININKYIYIYIEMGSSYTWCQWQSQNFSLGGAKLKDSIKKKYINQL